MIYSGLSGSGDNPAMRREARRDIAVSIQRAAPGTRPLVPGIAQPYSTKGLNVLVFNECIKGAARIQEQEHSDVLGNAIAHEIGHVLLGSADHKRRGLVAAVWTAREYHWRTVEFVLFTSDEEKKIRQSLSGGSTPDNSLWFLQRGTDPNLW
jgi:hypothetical protein